VHGLLDKTVENNITSVVTHDILLMWFYELGKVNHACNVVYGIRWWV